MNIAGSVNPIYIDLPEVICDDCGEEVDLESYLEPCPGCCGGCTRYRTEMHHGDGFGCQSERYTEIDWPLIGACALASYHRPEGIP